MLNDHFGLAQAFKRIAIPQKFGHEIPDNISPRLFVMRHGESWGQVRKEYYQELGDEKLPLTKWGRLQASAGGELLRDLDIGVFEVFHSTCTRASETAREAIQSIGQGKIKSVTADIRINKQIFGLFSGLFTDAERQAEYPAAFEAYQRDLREHGMFYARPPGGESLADTQAKTDEFIRDIFCASSSTTRNILVVTHGTPALCIENSLLNHGSDWLLDNMDTMPNCAIRLIEKENDQFIARTIGEGVPRPKPSSVSTPAFFTAGL